MHQEGHGYSDVDRDFGKAADCYLQAAALGDTNANKNFDGLVEKIEKNHHISETGKVLQFQKLFPVYLRVEKLGDASDRLKNLYKNPLGLQGAIQYYLAIGDTEAIAAAHKLYEEKKPDQKFFLAFRPLFFYYLEQTKKDDVTACLHVARMYQYGDGVNRDFGKAAESYLKAAELGDPGAKEAFYELYDLIESLVYNRKVLKSYPIQPGEREKQKEQFQNLLPIYLKKAEAGDVRICNILASAYKDGFYTPADYGKAIEYYLAAARFGDPKACELAQKFYDAQTRDKAAPDQTKTAIFEGCLREAQKDNKDAQYLVAKLYACGWGVDKNETMAIEWYVKAIRLGHPKALEEAEIIYQNNKSRNNYAPLFAYYLERAQNGDESLYSRVAEMYKGGWGIDQNETEALEWYGKDLARLVKAGQGGDEVSLEKARKIYNYVKDNFTLSPQRKIEIFEPLFSYYLKKANKEEMGDQFNVAVMYSEGHGVALSFKDAAEWFLKSSSKGYFDAQIRFYLLYSKVKKISDSTLHERLYHEISPYYLQEAEKKDVRAEYIVGKMFQKKRGTEQSYEKAQEWYQKAESQGSMKAKFRLGHLYEAGNGVIRNVDRAVEYYKAAGSKRAKQGLYRIGQLYEIGKGVEKNVELSFACYKQSGTELAKDAVSKFIVKNPDCVSTATDKPSLLSDLITELKETLLKFQPFGDKRSAFTDPKQSDSIKSSDLGISAHSIEAAMELLSQVKPENLENHKAGLLMTAMTVKQPVFGFIETHEFDGTPFATIGKENCLYAGLITKALNAFKSVCPNLIDHKDGNAAAIKSNKKRLFQLAPLCLEDATKEIEYNQISSAQKRIEKDQERLQAYQNAGEKLESFVRRGLSSRNAQFLENQEFEYLRGR